MGKHINKRVFVKYDIANMNNIELKENWCKMNSKQKRQALRQWPEVNSIADPIVRHDAFKLWYSSNCCPTCVTEYQQKYERIAEVYTDDIIYFERNDQEALYIIDGACIGCWCII